MPSETSTVPNADQKRQTFFKRPAMGIVLIAGVIYLLVEFNPIFRYFYAPSSAMAPALPVGAKFVVNRTSYGFSAQSFDWFPLPIKKRWPLTEPKRGDIAVFRAEFGGKSTMFVSRLVGLPGERIQMKSGRLYIDDKVIERSPLPAVQLPDYSVRYANGTRTVQVWTERLPNGVSYPIWEADGDTGFFDHTPEYKIPAGHYFLLGDNRDNSTDSRLPRQRGGPGMIQLEDFIGKVVWVSGVK